MDNYFEFECNRFIHSLCVTPGGDLYHINGSVPSGNP